MSVNLIKALAVVAELTGTELSVDALRVMASDLSAYPEEKALKALHRCRQELHGRMTLAAVLERIQEDDGRPTADEAWALALEAQDEALTVVWTNEIQTAFGVARPVLSAGDKVGARMAFRDAYERILRDARMAKLAPVWAPSIGWDVGHRVTALTRAVERGVLSPASVSGYLPAPSVDLLALPMPADQQESALEKLAKIKTIIYRPVPDSRISENDRRADFERRKREAQEKVAKYLREHEASA